jgi:hypothetical protein
VIWRAIESASATGNPDEWAAIRRMNRRHH